MKITKTILTSVLSVSLLLSTPIYNKKLNIYAVNKNEYEIMNAIKNIDHINDMEKINFDSENKEVESIENINLNSRGLNLSDGTYLIDRGDGWVLGNDESFIESQFAGPGEDTKLMKGKTVGTINKLMVGSSVGIDLGAVKLAVEAAYDYAIVNEDNLVAGFRVIAPENQSVYAKSYITYKRYDMIKINEGLVKGYTSTYEPNGTWVKTINYTDGKKVDQNALKEKVCRNVLNEPELVNIKNCISVSGCDNIKSLDIMLNGNDNTINILNRSNHAIHPRFGNKEYFSIKLIDKDSKEVKNSMTMSGNDHSSDTKFDSFDKTKYNIGDIIEIHHEEPYLIGISGSYYGNVRGTSTEQKYSITQYGLEAI